MTLMKSVLVRRPANVDVLESHSGAETMPVHSSSVLGATELSVDCTRGKHTVLHQDVHTGSDEEVVVEHDEPEGQR